MKAFLFALFVFVALPAHAAGVTVRDAWIRYINAGVPAAGYFTLVNDTDRPVRLTGVTSPVFKEAMLHKTMMGSGMARMESVPSIEVPAHGELEVAPGGYHVMLIGPLRKLSPGDRVPIILEFAGGDTVTAQFTARGATAR